MQKTKRIWTAVFAGSVLALGVGGCEMRPQVVLGHAPVPPMNSAGMNPSAAGRGDDDQEDHPCSEIDPVCGGDNTTYLNACRAADAGVSVQHRGAC
jgi:hypothetical protein